VRTVCEAIAGGSGSSWILREWIPETVFRGDYARRFSLDLMLKDMGLIEALAGPLGVPTPALDVAAARFERAVAEGYGGSDFSLIVALSARDAGAELPADMQHEE
jgi:3-hydroxyisobutyrate dehydrogenase-like beta-hydroxyacid dehydrogenase